MRERDEGRPDAVGDVVVGETVTIVDTTEESRPVRIPIRRDGRPVVVPASSSSGG